MKTHSKTRLAIACLILATAGCSLGAPGSNPKAQLQPLSGVNSPAEALGSTGQAQLRGAIDKQRLADLQWPNFSDVSMHVRELYEKDGYALVWTREGKPTQQALDLIAVLEQADKKGLDSKDYDGEKWANRLKSLQGAAKPDEAALVNFDLALTVSGLRYSSDLHLGKVDPHTLHTDFEPERNEYDLCDFLLKRVAPAANVSDAFAKIETPYGGYQRVLAGLEKYEQLEKEEKPNLLPTVAKPVAPGQPYAAAPQLLDRLKFLGDLPASASLGADPHLYQGDVVEGVKHFQARHGLDAQGKLGAQTITELNVPMSTRVMQLKLALERWRWLPHNFDVPPIVVNIPEFLLRGYDENHKITVMMPVVVGRALRTETPVMEEDMKYLIFWPYWNVPPSILRNEIVPKVTKDRAYIQKNEFEVTTYAGEVVTDGVISDDVLAQLKAGKLTVRQKPGPKNALGLIKFIFPNNNNVYLHSTPSQAAFSETRRDFSHGCVRVEDPAKLAEYVLRNNAGWTRERVDAAFKAQKQEQVNLTKPIPVLIVYGTAISPDDGQVHFFEDIYGHDKTLGALFNQAYASRN
jgi:murein L,D-transpeptidase YcbB/YkuD